MNYIGKVLAFFPGQGSQKVGMGASLYESYPRAREYFKLADDVLGFSLSKVCFEGPPEKLTSTGTAQPAVLTVSLICYELFRERREGVEIAAGAGHSLGEYSALTAAGALDFTDAVLLVHKRGRYMQEAVPEGRGKMAAVLGKKPEDVEHALLQVQSGICQAANLNAPGQIVVSGEKEAVDEFIEILGNAKVRELEVSAPFHCSLMKPAEEALRKDLSALSIRKPSFPVYANWSGKAVTEPEEIRDALARQVCGQVRWIECVQNAASDTSVFKAVEFGEGKTISGMVKRINKDIECLSWDRV